MPTYEYRCSACESVFEVFQSIKSPPLRRATCEVCGGVRPVRRMIGTGGAVLFKGSGFYQTDYRSESYQKAAKADSGEAKSEPAQSKTDAPTTKDESAPKPEVESGAASSSKSSGAESAVKKAAKPKPPGGAGKKP